MKNATRSIFQPDRDVLRLTFLAFSGASIMCLASAVDPLRAANRVIGERRFDVAVVTVDGAPIVTTSGLKVVVDGAFDPNASTDVFAIIGGFGSRLLADKALLAAIRAASRNARATGGIEAGSWVLGHAGLLDRGAATTHWEDLEDFAAAFPRCDVRPDRYVIDEPFFTAGGAAPTFDLMLHLVRSRIGMAVALDAASVFLYDQARAATEAQPLVSLGRLQGHNPRLALAIELMERHVENPLPTSAIARRVGVSTRTLETIFAKSIGETPGAYALRLRLHAARRLVIDTRAPMAEVATRCGFSSPAAFSRAFAQAYGQAPSHLRRIRMG